MGSAIAIEAPRATKLRPGAHPIVALGASMAMALPISTPPNAIAYSAGSFNTKQMVVSGSVIAVVGMGLTYLCLPILLKMAGLG